MMVTLQALLSACSLHVDPALLTAMVDAFSHGNPHAVVDARWSAPSQSEPLVDSPSSAAQALRRIRLAQERGGSPVFGLLPVSLAWSARYGRPPAQLLDPCQSVAVASAELSAFAAQCRSARKRACILALYGREVSLPGLAPAVLSHLKAPASPVVARLKLETRLHEGLLFFSLSQLDSPPGWPQSHSQAGGR